MFDPELRFAGVILNGVVGEGHYRLLADAINSNCGTRILGWLPHEHTVHIPERHLGLQTSDEIDWNAKSHALCDLAERQLGQTRGRAQREGLNIEFRKGSVYQLPFEDGQFDAIFSHAVLEHLSDPLAAIAEFRRVLKPGGLIGLRAGDLGGMLLDAETEGPAQAFASYLAQQRQGDKDPNVGRKLARLMRQTGFSVEKMTASYEVISDLLMKLGPTLAEQFTMPGSFCKLQDRSELPSLFVALAWCEATGRAV